MESLDFDVVVIGAGCAGLMAAMEISSAGHKVAVIEADERAGGRVKSVPYGNTSIELGAEFVHGNLALTRELLASAGADSHAVNGSIWQKTTTGLRKQDDFIEDFELLEKKLRQLVSDKPVADFIENDLAGSGLEKLQRSLLQYAEGYYAADTTKASTVALRNELLHSDDEQYRVDGGYARLVDYLVVRCRDNGVNFFLGKPVHEILWKKDKVTARSRHIQFHGKKILVTIPIGALQQNKISFIPSMSGVMQNLGLLGFGHVIKIVLVFSEAFWKRNEISKGGDRSDMSFLFSEESIPTWWTQYPTDNTVLTGWLGGPKAEDVSVSGNEVLVTKALSSLSALFQINADDLQLKLVKSFVHNWSANPYTCGAYSYEVVGGNEIIKQLQQPVENTVYFAGEGLHPGPAIGTVEGALVSGRETARRLIADFSG